MDGFYWLLGLLALGIIGAIVAVRTRGDYVADWLDKPSEERTGPYDGPD